MPTRARLAVVVAAAMIIAGLAPPVSYAAPRGGAPFAPAEAETAKTYYVTQYDGTVWEVTRDSIAALTYGQWQSAGSPRPRPAPTDYVKYPWSSTVSAVTFFGPERERWIWKHVSFAEWSRAGKPSPRHAGWITGSTFYKWATSSQIFVQDVGGVKHALTAQEWAASGWAPFSTRTNQGFVRLSWDDSIAFLTDLSGGSGGGPISYAQWAAEGFPHPRVTARLPGDQVYRDSGSSTVYYAGPTVHRAITYAEWSAMGQPSPAVRGGPLDVCH